MAAPAPAQPASAHAGSGGSVRFGAAASATATRPRPGGTLPALPRPGPAFFPHAATSSAAATMTK